MGWYLKTISTFPTAQILCCEILTRGPGPGLPYLLALSPRAAASLGRASRVRSSWGCHGVLPLTRRAGADILSSPAPRFCPHGPHDSAQRWDGPSLQHKRCNPVSKAEGSHHHARLMGRGGVLSCSLLPPRSSFRGWKIRKWSCDGKKTKGRFAVNGFGVRCVSGILL